ncbi:MAG: YihY/virulence factor BrkB family protein [Deltaproteobacteria bacterium]|nr:YihY/virulence factor BrkB family protein [Deltaproteobacteria bacterium]
MKIFKEFIDGIKLLYRSIVDLIKDNGMIYAAATSFYFILSFFPVILLIVYVSVQTLGFVYKGISISEISSQLFKYIKEVLPFLPDSMVKELSRIIKSSRGVGIAGLIALMLSSTAVAESLIQAARTIFNVQKAHFVLAKILTISVFMGVGILLALLLAVTSFVSSLMMHNFPAVYKFVSVYKGNILFSTIIPVVLIFLSYVVITYLLVPVKRRIGVIARVGVFFTLFFMLAKILYGYYLKNVTKMTVFYGSISALVVLILWVFYITTLYLISLEIIKNVFKQQAKDN